MAEECVTKMGIEAEVDLVGNLSIVKDGRKTSEFWNLFEKGELV